MSLIETISMEALILLMFWASVIIFTMSQFVDYENHETKPKTIYIILTLFFIFLFLVSMLGVFTKTMGYNLIP